MHNYLIYQSSKVNKSGNSELRPVRTVIIILKDANALYARAHDSGEKFSGRFF